VVLLFTHWRSSHLFNIEELFWLDQSFKDLFITSLLSFAYCQTPFTNLGIKSDFHQDVDIQVKSYFISYFGEYLTISVAGLI